MLLHLKRTSLELRENLEKAFEGYDPPSITDYVDAPSLQNASDAYAEKAEAFANASLREVDYDVDLLTTMDVQHYRHDHLHFDRDGPRPLVGLGRARDGRRRQRHVRSDREVRVPHHPAGLRLARRLVSADGQEVSG